MTEVSQEPGQAISDGRCMRMQLVELHLNQTITLKQEPARQAQDILAKPSRAKLGEWFTGEHPLRRPGQEVVCDIGEQNQSFLGRQVFLASAFEEQATFISLDFGLAGATVIIVGDDFGQRPREYGADNRAVLGLACAGLPLQEQMLCRPYVSHSIAGGRHPTLLAQILPGVLRNLVCVGLRTPTALAFP